MRTRHPSCIMFASQAHVTFHDLIQVPPLIFTEMKTPFPASWHDSLKSVFDTQPCLGFYIGDILNFIQLARDIFGACLSNHTVVDDFG